MIKRLLPLLVLVCAVAPGACVTKSSTEPDPPEPSGYSNTVTGTVEAFQWTHHELSVPRSGSLRVELTWADGGDLDLHLTLNTCTGPLDLTCEPLESSFQGDTSEVITRTVSTGEQFRLWVDSYVTTGPRNYTLKITID